MTEENRENGLIRYEDVHNYALEGVHGGDLEYEDFDAIVNAIASVPQVDAVEVADKELRKAIKLLIEEYGHSKASEYVHSPVAHALYHTWKRVEEKNRGKEPLENHGLTEQAYKKGYEDGRRDAVPVAHGRWIKGEYPGEYTCSRCGMEYCEADPDEKPFKHCPECGSKNE